METTVLFDSWVEVSHNCGPTQVHHLKIYRDGVHYEPVIARETQTNDGLVWVPVTGITTDPQASS